MTSPDSDKPFRRGSRHARPTHHGGRCRRRTARLVLDTTAVVGFFGGVVSARQELEHLLVGRGMHDWDPVLASLLCLAGRGVGVCSNE
jgi:hypothetical protein